MCFSFLALSMYSQSGLKLQVLLSKIATSRGFNAVEGLILGFLLVHPSFMTQREIAKAVGRSQSTVSRALQRMTERSIVKWNRKKGSREMVFSIVSEKPKNLVLSGILGWVKSSSILRDELKQLIKEQEHENDGRVEKIAKDIIGAIDIVIELLNPVICSLEEQNKRL